MGFFRRVAEVVKKVVGFFGDLFESKAKKEARKQLSAGSQIPAPPKKAPAEPAPEDLRLALQAADQLDADLACAPSPTEPRSRSSSVSSSDDCGLSFALGSSRSRSHSGVSTESSYGELDITSNVVTVSPRGSSRDVRPASPNGFANPSRFQSSRVAQSQSLPYVVCESGLYVGMATGSKAYTWRLMAKLGEIDLKCLEGRGFLDYAEVIVGVVTDFKAAYKEDVNCRPYLVRFTKLNQKTADVPHFYRGVAGVTIKDKESFKASDWKPERVGGRRPQRRDRSSAFWQSSASAASVGGGSVCRRSFSAA
jgi:hypothetical protein